MVVIKAIKDIGDVVEESEFHETGGVIVVQAEIVAVTNVDSYTNCRSCYGKVTETKKGVGECTKCNSKIKVSKSKHQSIVRVVLEVEGGKEYKVTMFGEIVQKILKMSKDLVGNDEELGYQIFF